MHLRKFLMLSSLLMTMATLPITSVLAEESTVEEIDPAGTVELVEPSSEPVMQDPAVTENPLSEEEPITDEEIPALVPGTTEPVTTVEDTTVQDTEEPTTNSEPVVKTEPKSDDPKPSDYTHPNKTQNLKPTNPANVVSMPNTIVGTWTARRGDMTILVVIRPDGSGTQILTFDGRDDQRIVHFQIGKLEMMLNKYYRYLDGTNLHLIGFGGLGGYLVKYEHGFSLSSGNFQPIYWTTRVDLDFDYSQPIFHEEMTRVTPQEPRPTAPAATPLATPATNQPAKQTNRPSLPKTGEAASALLPILGVGLLAGIGFFAFKNRKK